MNKKEVGSMKKTGENSLADVLRSGYMIAETCLEQIMKYDGEEVARLFQDPNVLRELLPLRSDYPVPESIQGSVNHLSVTDDPQNLLYRAIKASRYDVIEEICNYCLHVDALEAFYWYAYAFVEEGKGNYFNAAKLFFLSSLLKPMQLDCSAEKNCLFCLAREKRYREIVSLVEFWDIESNPRKLADLEECEEIICCAYSAVRTQCQVYLTRLKQMRAAV